MGAWQSTSRVYIQAGATSRVYIQAETTSRVYIQAETTSRVYIQVEATSRVYIQVEAPLGSTFTFRWKQPLGSSLHSGPKTTSSLLSHSSLPASIGHTTLA